MTAPVMSAERTAARAVTPRESATVGIVGGGQLARMLQQAAIPLDITLRVLTDDPGAPAVRAGAVQVPGRADRLEDLRRLSAGCDVVTFEHELVDPELLEVLAREVPVRPGAAALVHAQNKLLARRAFREAGLPVPAFRVAEDLDALLGAAAELGWPVVVKRPSGGYDGRGVWFLGSPAEARSWWQQEQPQWPVLVEERVDFVAELAITVARRPGGEHAVLPAVQTVHEDGICTEAWSPPSLGSATVVLAEQLALRLANHLDVSGLLVVELFVRADGSVLINELALRPHNSGHLTIDACRTSQFAQHLRAVLDWPLGDPTATSPAAMINLLGEQASGSPAAMLAEPGVYVHRYGKAARPGRKVGHLTALGTTTEEARATAHRALERGTR